MPDFAVDDEDADTPSALMPRGTYATDPTGTLVVNPLDARSLRRHADSGRLNGCCDLDGLDGPNMVCQNCAREVATLKNDCWVGRATLRFDPTAVRQIQE